MAEMAGAVMVTVLCSKKKTLVLALVPSLHDHRFLNSRPMAYYRKGGTTPCLRPALRSPAFGWHIVISMGIHSAINIQIIKLIGGGAQWVEFS